MSEIVKGFPYEEALDTDVINKQNGKGGKDVRRVAKEDDITVGVVVKNLVKENKITPSFNKMEYEYYRGMERTNTDKRR